MIEVGVGGVLIGMRELEGRRNNRCLMKNYQFL